MYDKLVTKVNSIEASSKSGLVSKTQYDSDKEGLEIKIEDVIRKYLTLAD